MFTDAQLLDEIQTDAKGLGLKAQYDIGQDAVVAALLNEVRAGVDYVVKRADITPAEVLEAIDIRDLTVPGTVTQPALAASWLESITQQPRLRLTKEDGSNTVVRGNLNRLVGATNGSQGRLDAIAVRQGSRAEILWGTGTLITSDDIGRTRQEARP